MRRFEYAFGKSVPVLCGYLFLGIAFGILLTQNGYNAIWALFMSTFIYAGSLQFVMIPMMAGSVSLVTMAITTLLINGRHIFYGLSFTDSFSDMKAKPYMIFSLTDETYSVLCGCKARDTQLRNRNAWFLIALLNHMYWIIGSVIGALLGTALPFDFTGIEFSMTALFTVILIEQILRNKRKAGFAALVGILVGLILLRIMGPDVFLLPTMLVTVLIVGGVEVAKKDASEVKNG